jgi:hypothetical protein
MLLRYSPKTDHLKMVALTPVEGVAFTKTLVQLLPGVNEVTEEEWKCMRPNIADELERGEIKILAQKVSDGRGKPGGRKAKDLVQMPVNIAVNYVNECMNPETLLKWYKEETREEVRIYITRKLEKLGVEIPDVDIPEAPNASPMTLDEYDEEKDESIDEDAIEEEDDVDDEEDAETSDVDDSIDYNAMNKTDLIAKAKELGIAGADAMNKKQLVEAITSTN